MLAVDGMLDARLAAEVQQQASEELHLQLAQYAGLVSRGQEVFAAEG